MGLSKINIFNSYELLRSWLEVKRIRVKLNKRKSIWYLRYTYQGKEIKESTGTDNQDKAERIREEFVNL